MSTRFTVYKNKERVVFNLDSPLSLGRVRLHIVFSGVLNDYLQGFYRSKYIITAPGLTLSALHIFSGIVPCFIHLLG